MRRWIITVSGRRVRNPATRATIAQLIANPAVIANYSALHGAGYWFGNTQIRNMATVMGNILRASPSADCSCAILAVGGKVVLQSKAGIRTVDIDDFWLSYDVTARKSDELAVEIRLPEPKATTRTTFQRLTRVRQDLAKLNLAVRLEMDNGACQQARIAIGCVGPTTMRLKQAEKMLAGRTINDDLLEQIAASVQGEITPIDDQRSTAAYRRQVAGVLVEYDGLPRNEHAFGVALLGSVAAIAVPAFVREVHASRFVEPTDGLVRLGASAVIDGRGHLGGGRGHEPADKEGTQDSRCQGVLPANTH